MDYQGNPLYKKNILTKSFDFSLDIIRFCVQYRKTGESVLSHQLLKSGTSIGANLREAQNAESTKDFIHKIKIALKEADETEYWLLLIKGTEAKVDVNVNAQLLLNKLEVLLKILQATITKLKKQ